MNEHNELYEEALEAVRNLFEDISVSAEKTSLSLRDIANEINDMRASLEL